MIVILSISRDTISYTGFIACTAIGALFCIKQYAITTAVGHISSDIVGIMHYFTVVFLLIYQYCFHHQPLNHILIMGFILIVSGVVLTIRKSPLIPTVKSKSLI